MEWLKVEISPRGAEQIKGGSLWVFANEFVTKMNKLKKGEWVHFESKGRPIGSGYVNPHSLIAGRLCSHGPLTDRPAFFKDRIQAAIQRRLKWGFKTSCRLVFSESDFLPGLIVDLYVLPGTSGGFVLAAHLGTAGMDVARDDIAVVLEALARGPLSEFGDFRGLILRGDSSIRGLEGLKNFVEVIAGQENELKAAALQEDEVVFAADFISGQKTGFFLDQKENRRILKTHSRNISILDLCCYSGGWGLSALKGGARHVTFVDQSREALDLVQRGLSLNGFEKSSVRLVESDVFDFLEKEGESFDVVVADPPAFVKSKKNLPQAIRAYTKLNSLALRRVSEGGRLFSSSCSYHLSEVEFENILRESLRKTGRLGRVFHRGLQSADHPWVINRPESKYLKCYGIEIS